MTERPGLGDPPRPQGRYLPAVLHNGLVMSAGMTPRIDGELVFRGTVGGDLDLAQAGRAAALAAGNALRAVIDVAGGIERIERALRMTVYLVCAPGFTQHSVVADAASEALLAALGDRGTVARSAIGVASLPSGAPVEVELLAAVRQQWG